MIGPFTAIPYICNQRSLTRHIFTKKYLISAERSQQQSGKGNKTPINNDHPDNKKPTWISDIFQGIFTSETRCLNCETVTSKDEDFFDLSIDVEQNTSITSCLKNFSNTETLCSDNKFQCDSCCTLQEARVSLAILPIFRKILVFLMVFFAILATLWPLQLPVA